MQCLKQYLNSVFERLTVAEKQERLGVHLRRKTLRKASRMYEETQSKEEHDTRGTEIQWNWLKLEPRKEKIIQRDYI